MARTKGTYSLPANIETNAAAPLDARSVVVQKSDLTASGSFPYPYIGMQVYVRSEEKRYTLTGSDPTVLANWHDDSTGGGGGASNFADLDDVNFSNLQNGQVPKYNSNTQKWENKEDSLANLSDVSMLSFSDKQVLSYNDRTQKWENKPNKVSRLSDVSLNSPSDGDILRYDAQNDVWKNSLFPDDYHVYSTTEKIVGTWVDGKSVYEKTYVLDNYAYNADPQNLTYTVDVHSLSIDTLVSLGGIWERYSGNRKKLYYTFGSYEKGYAESYIRLDSENGYTKGKVQMGLFTEGTTYQQFTIQYTKTTD